MKIGLVGTEYTIQIIRSTLKFEELFVDITEYPCEVENMVSLLDKIQTEQDGILFTGKFFFTYACRNTSATIPWVYAKRTMSSVLHALLQATASGVDISKITYDLDWATIGRMANLLCKDVGLPLDALDIYRFDDADCCSVTSEDYRRNAAVYHLKNLQSGRATACISGSPNVVEYVKQKGYSAFYVQPTEEDLNLAINELRARHEIYRRQKGTEEYQLAVIAVSVEFPDINDYGTQLHSRYQVEKCVFDFAQSIGASVEKPSSTQYLIYSIKAELGVVTSNFTKFSFLQKIQLISGIDYVTAGIGTGISHVIAKSNACYCDKIAKKQKYSCYYVMSGTAPPTGPFWLGTGKMKKEFTEVSMERTSNETGVSVTILSILVKAQLQYGFDTVTPGRLVEMCKMTVSNMNRIISKLEKAGYAEIVGVQHHNGAGRPNRLIRLNIIVNE